MSKPMADSITVTAICTAHSRLEYKGVDTRSGTTIFRQSMEAGNIETGNFLAIVQALRLLKRNSLDGSTIYCDSPEAIRWVKEKKCASTKHNGQKIEKLAEAVDEAEKWLAENDYKTKILKWDTKEWDDIKEVVYPRQAGKFNAL